MPDTEVLTAYLRCLKVMGKGQSVREVGAGQEGVATFRSERGYLDIKYDASPTSSDGQMGTCVARPSEGVQIDTSPPTLPMQRGAGFLHGALGVGGDDVADALRYLIATKGRTIIERRLTGF